MLTCLCSGVIIISGEGTYNYYCYNNYKVCIVINILDGIGVFVSAGCAAERESVRASERGAGVCC